MKIMSSKFNKSFVSQVPDLCYDGWGLTLSSTLYQELILSKQFAQLISSVEAFVKTRDEGAFNPSTNRKPKLKAVSKKKSNVPSTIPEEDAADEDDESNLKIDEDGEESDEPIFDEEDDHIYENISTDSDGYDEMEESARKKIKIIENP
jgi:hypothetical protein